VSEFIEVLESSPPREPVRSNSAPNSLLMRTRRLSFSATVALWMYSAPDDIR
jgi:hypothetical protein